MSLLVCIFRAYKGKYHRAETKQNVKGFPLPWVPWELKTLSKLKETKGGKKNEEND